MPGATTSRGSTACDAAAVRKNGSRAVDVQGQHPVNSGPQMRAGFSFAGTVRFATARSAERSYMGRYMMRAFPMLNFIRRIASRLSIYESQVDEFARPMQGPVAQMLNCDLHNLDRLTGRCQVLGADRRDLSLSGRRPGGGAEPALR